MRSWAKAVGSGAIVSFFGLSVLLPSVAEATPTWSLEFVDPSGTSDLETLRPFLHRTLRVELQDLVVRAEPERLEDGPEDVRLHVLVEATSRAFHVEIWDRGERAGRRVVSPDGSPPVVARRIALAVLELARDLSKERERRAFQLEAARERAHLVELELEQRERVRRLTLGAGVEGTVLPGQAALVGPGARLSFNGDLPFRLSLNIGYQLGGLEALRARQGGPLLLSEIRVALEPAYVLGAFERQRFEVGPILSGSALHVVDGAEFDGLSGQSSSYTLGFGGKVGYEHLVNQILSLRIGVEASVLLRSVPIVLASEQTELSGVRLGLVLGMMLRP